MNQPDATVLDIREKMSGSRYEHRECCIADGDRKDAIV